MAVHNSTRAKNLLKQRQKVWQDKFKACHGDTKKVGHEKQTKLNLR